MSAARERSTNSQVLTGRERRQTTMPAAPAPPQKPPQQRVNQLRKSQSWSPDVVREEVWQRKKRFQKVRRSHSVSMDDLDELKACHELGFRFDVPRIDPKLTKTFPALELYHFVKKQYDTTNNRSRLSRSSSASDCSSSSSSEEEVAAEGPELRFFQSGEDPKMVKTRIKQWVQVVACVLKEATTN